MVWEVCAASLDAYAAAHKAAAAQKSQQYWAALGAIPPYQRIKVNGPTIEEAAREHRQRMDAMHADTMRGAKVGTLLLMALLVTAAYGLAQLAGIA